MKRIVGNETNGKKFWMATYLGEPYLSSGVVNVYFNTKQLEEDLVIMKTKAISSLTVPKDKDWRLKVYRKYRNGRFFITDLSDPRCEIKIVDQKTVRPTDTTKTVALRKEIISVVEQYLMKF